MNDAADEPQEATSKKSQIWKPSAEQLQDILEKHKKWWAAEDKTTRRPDLSGVDLQGRVLDMAHLPEAWLIGANLQRASLTGANLQEANLIRAQLQEAKLGDAQLQGAYLDGAQLQGANLYQAQLHGATLQGAIFESREIKEDGEPGQDLPAAYLTDADFREADLSNAQLSTVTGLRAEMLAGAVLTNAKLPDDVAKFDRLTHAAETSKHAGTTFFALLAASLYSWLTIGTTTDVALITGAASSPLPIINTNIALSGFYWVAPLILLGVYGYLHLYLQRLWHDLSTLPAVFPDGEELDAKVYPWLLNGLVRAHFAHLKLRKRPFSRLENLVSIALAWWVVPLTLLFFWLRYVPRHDWWGTGLHVALITIAVGFGVHSYRLAVRTLSGADQPPARLDHVRVLHRDGRFYPACALHDEPLWTWIWRGIRSYRPDRWTILALSLALVLSVGVAIAPGNDLLTTLGYETYADLTDDDVSTKPSGWTGREGNAEVEIAQVKGADLEGRDLRDADARGAFLVKAKLSEANLGFAALTGADLRGANLSDADLTGANLSDANLSDANLNGANLTRANLTRANLTRANLHGASLSDAHLPGTNLSNADLSFADVSDTSLPGANLSNADLSSADLSYTTLDANLSNAALRGANLSDADLGGANLSNAKLRGANLSDANLSDADLSSAREMTQVQLDGACGDDWTQLPEGLTISMCIPDAEARERAARERAIGRLR